MWFISSFISREKQLEEKDREIIESINYAKSLQKPLIPPVKAFQSIMPYSFVLFEPKDIVSGDFNQSIKKLI
jgi:hypothetical protein